MRTSHHTVLVLIDRLGNAHRTGAFANPGAVLRQLCVFVDVAPIGSTDPDVSNLPADSFLVRCTDGGVVHDIYCIGKYGHPIGFRSLRCNDSAVTTLLREVVGSPSFIAYCEYSRKIIAGEIKHTHMEEVVTDKSELVTPKEPAPYGAAFLDYAVHVLTDKQLRAHIRVLGSDEYASCTLIGADTRLIVIGCVATAKPAIYVVMDDGQRKPLSDWDGRGVRGKSEHPLRARVRAIVQSLAPATDDAKEGASVVDDDRFAAFKAWFASASDAGVLWATQLLDPNVTKVLDDAKIVVVEHDDDTADVHVRSDNGNILRVTGDFAASIAPRIMRLVTTEPVDQYVNRPWMQRLFYSPYPVNDASLVQGDIYVNSACAFRRVGLSWRTVHDPAARASLVQAAQDELVREDSQCREPRCWRGDAQHVREMALARALATQDVLLCERLDQVPSDWPIGTLTMCGTWREFFYRGVADGGMPVWLPIAKDHETPYLVQLRKHVCTVVGDVSSPTGTLYRAPVKYTINQTFAEGFDPDKVATEFAKALTPHEENKTMTTKEPSSLVKTLQVDATDAAWRTAGSQFVKLTREPLVAVLSRHLGPDDPALRARIAAFLETEIGTALLASILSMALQAMPTATGDVPQRLSRELRVRAMSDTSDLVADVVMGPLRKVVALYLHDGVRPAVDVAGLTSGGPTAAEELAPATPVAAKARR